MNQEGNKCVVVLSTKSSGSSAIQRLLAALSCSRRVRYTRHGENETLYWTKAASALGLPQIKMLDSEVPIAPRRARRELLAFLRKNTGESRRTQDTRQWVFDGWERLCQTHRPVFLEKSPHHLVQWAALELMLDCDVSLSSTEFLYVGLVRNPMDALYSAWSRWRTFPEYAQFEWELAYRNLEGLRARLGERLVVVRYEDIVQDLASLAPVIEFVGAGQDELPTDFLHARSVNKRRDDPRYGFQLALSVRELASTFGYDEVDLEHREVQGWERYRDRARRLYEAQRVVRAPFQRFRRVAKHLLNRSPAH